MTSENYRQLLNDEYVFKGMHELEFDNTLMQFAMFYHKEQLNIPVVSKCNCKTPERKIKVSENGILDYCGKCSKSL